MNHKDILGEGVLIKPNGDRFEVFVGKDRIIYMGRPVFDYQMITKTEIQIRPRFNPGDGNPIVNNEMSHDVVVKENYEVDGYWQLIPDKKPEQLSESVKPTKKGTSVSTTGSEVKKEKEEKEKAELKAKKEAEIEEMNKPISSKEIGKPVSSKKSSRKK